MAEINLWLDDERTPPSFEKCGLQWEWAKTADAAIEILKGGNVAFASLDHDLADEHYAAYITAMQSGAPVDTSWCKEKTGLAVLDWMAEHDVWPEEGVRIHTMNPPRKQIMLTMVETQYGRTFQYQIPGTHRV